MELIEEEISKSLTLCNRTWEYDEFATQKSDQLTHFLLKRE